MIISQNVFPLGKNKIPINLAWRLGGWAQQCALQILVIMQYFVESNWVYLLK